MNQEKVAEVEEDFLAEVVEGEEIGAEIVLDDPVQADYQIQRIARLKMRQDEITAFVTRQMGELQAYLERRLTVLQREVEWRSKPLEIYVRAANRANPKVKSLDLPHGKLKLRAEREKVECEESELLKWCDEHTDAAERFVMLIRRINRPDLHKYIKESGEIPDGVTIVPPGEPNFHLEFKDFGEPPLVLVRRKEHEE